MANFIGDYPEQVLVTSTYYGECPKCIVPHDQLGDSDRFLSCDYRKALETYALADGDVRTFNAACRDSGIKPIFHPFWETLPLANIYVSVTPDILHQLLQGVMKHLIAWVSDPLIFGGQSIDARCQLMPPNHQISLFPKGISILSRVSGKEHKNICQLLLGLVVDLRISGGSSSAHLLKAVNGLLDFLYLAQLPSQTANTISCLEHALLMFHQNKGIFVDLGVQDHFNILKIHSLLHYSSSIRLFSSTDNYNTEQMEWLHIDFMKNAYRSTNHKDEYPQMTTWMERCEKIQEHAVCIKFLQQQQFPASAMCQRSIGMPPQPSLHHLKMT